MTYIIIIIIILIIIIIYPKVNNIMEYYIRSEDRQRLRIYRTN